MTPEPSEFEPIFDEVVDLLEGKLSEKKAAEVRKAIGSDFELVRAALDAIDPQGLADVANLEPKEVEEAWAQFQAEHDSVRGKDSPTKDTGFEQHPLEESSEPLHIPNGFLVQATREHPWTCLIAACLLGITLTTLFFGLSGLGFTAHDGSGKVLVERLERVGASRQARGPSSPIEIDEEIGVLVLLLPPPSSLLVEVPERADYTVLWGDGTKVIGETIQQDEGYFALLLSVDEVSTGDTEIRLYSQASSEPFATYKLSLIFENLR